MKKKLIASMLTMSMAAALFAGCGSASSDSSSDAAEATEAAATEEAAEETEEAAEETEEAAEETEEAAEETEEAADDSETAEAGWTINMDDMLAGSPFEGLTAEGDYSYEMIMKAYTASFFEAVQQGAEAAAEDLGVDLTCTGPNTESDIADQVNMFNAAINNHYDGVACAPSDSSALTDSLQLAIDEQVPIFGFDSGFDNPPEGSVLATIATDSPAAGAVGGENVYNAISYKLADADAPIRIGLVANDSTSASNTLRGLGFIDKIIELAGADGYKVAVIGNDFFVNGCSDAGDESDCNIIIECRVPATATVDQCATEVSVIMNEQDTVAVFGTNQTVTEGIVSANENLDVLSTDPDAGILGTGFDAGKIVKTAIADGTLYGAVTQMPYAMGYYTICSMIANNNGDTVEDLAIPAYWYNADNMEDELIAPNLYE